VLHIGEAQHKAQELLADWLPCRPARDGVRGGRGRGGEGSGRIMRSRGRLCCLLAESPPRTRDPAESPPRTGQCVKAKQRPSIATGQASH
jgi:hypothetical protein